MNDKTRNIEVELPIAESPETVWRAITEADEIVRWFALRAESEPGVGGHIGLSWNLKEFEPGRCEITAWEPNERLCMTWRAGPGEPRELPIEIVLRRTDGGTLLKLTHSGFLSDASWDEEFESHARGWNYELRSLRFYLERHLGRSRQYLLRKFPVDDMKKTWRQTVGKAGAFRPATDALAEGAEFMLGLPNGTTTAAELLYSFPGRDFVFAADVLKAGIFRIGLEVVSGEPQLWIWAFSWQLDQAALEGVARPIFDALDQRLTDG